MIEKLIEDIEQDTPPETLTPLELALGSLIPQGIEVPKPEDVFSMGGIPMFTKKSISTLIGKAKSGKTTATAWVVSNLINEHITTLWFDTEQGLYYGSRTQYWVLNIAGKSESEYLKFFDLKTISTVERSEVIEILIKELSPDMVIIDGSRDLIFDINSPEESTILANSLMKWSDMYNCHIMTILHTNKDGMNARGHIGTELMNKSETVIKVENNEGLIVCSPELTRSEPFNPFAFDRDDKGIPQLIENYMGDTTVTNSIGRKKSTLSPNDPNIMYKHIEVINKMFSTTEWLKYSEIITQLTMQFEVDGVTLGKSKAEEFVEYYRNECLLIHDKKQKGHAKWRSGLEKKSTLQPNDEF